MLLEFMVENYMSFKDMSTFSLIGTNDNEKIDEQIVIVNDKIRVLKNAALFGANASGKSNLLSAISFAKGFVINSSKDSQQGENINTKPFKFNTITESKPSKFEFTFIINDVVYRYGYSADEKKIISEWLFARYSTRETQLFVRNEQKITLGAKFKEGKKYIDSVRTNALFLSVCAQFNGEKSTEILKWFRKLNIISSLEDNYVSTTLEILDNENDQFSVQRKELINLITNIDVGIEDIGVYENEHDNFIALLEEMSVKHAQELLEKLKSSRGKDDEINTSDFKVASQEIKTVHNKYDGEKNLVSKEQYSFGIESRGTQKIFELAGPIIDTMFNDGVLFIDEIQNSLHTKLVISLIRFFMKNHLNIKSQFIITTHDTNVLASGLFRRDQLWFLEKNKYGESDLTCLIDFDEHVRKDASIDKDYLRGRYGAIPYISLEGMYGDR